MGRGTTEMVHERAALARVTSLLRRQPPAADLSADVRAAIAALVPYGLVCWGQLDPVSQLPVTNNRSSADAALARTAWISEFTHADVNAVPSLLRTCDHVGVLSMATAGELERSHRYRAILVPMGATDELRAVLSIGGLTWGWLVLFRFGGTFTGTDAKRVAALLPLLARSWRSAQLVPPTDIAEPGGPAMLVVDRHGRLDGVTLAGQVMLDQLPPGTMGPIPDVIQALAATTLSSLARGHDEAPAARTIVRGVGGRWLVVEAARLRGEAERVALSIAPAAHDDLAVVLLQAYGLTGRETEVALGILRHQTSAEIAAALHLSRWTVQDHLKAGFAKAGVRSRTDLALQLFAEYPGMTGFPWPIAAPPRECCPDDRRQGSYRVEGALGAGHLVQQQPSTYASTTRVRP